MVFALEDAHVRVLFHKGNVLVRRIKAAVDHCQPVPAQLFDTGESLAVIIDHKRRVDAYHSDDPRLVTAVPDTD